MTGFLIGLATGAVALFLAVALPRYRLHRSAWPTRRLAVLAAIREAWALL